MMTNIKTQWVGIIFRRFLFGHSIDGRLALLCTIISRWSYLNMELVLADTFLMDGSCGLQFSASDTNCGSKSIFWLICTGYNSSRTDYADFYRSLFFRFIARNRSTWMIDLYCTVLLLIKNHCDVLIRQRRQKFLYQLFWACFFGFAGTVANRKSMRMAKKCKKKKWNKNHVIGERIDWTESRCGPRWSGFHHAGRIHPSSVCCIRLAVGIK